MVSRRASARSAPRCVAAPAGDGYHHGSLREALLAAAEALLLERGVDAFTLRECARRAGVSHAAPAHHFGDVRGLLTAFATVGFERMADLMQRHADAAPRGAAPRLVAVGQAYIDFALAHRAHFQLMFGTDRLDATDPALQRAGQRTGDMLREAMAGVMAERRLPADTLPQRLLLAWSAVHGYATLVIEGQCLALFGLGMDQPRKASAAGAAILALLEPSLAGMPGPPPRSARRPAAPPG
jgi:AcrR family transcriptional regulator